MFSNLTEVILSTLQWTCSIHAFLCASGAWCVCSHCILHDSPASQCSNDALLTKPMQALQEREKEGGREREIISIVFLRFHNYFHSQKCVHITVAIREGNLYIITAEET